MGSSLSSAPCRACQRSLVFQRRHGLPDLHSRWGSPRGAVLSDPRHTHTHTHTHTHAHTEELGLCPSAPCSGDPTHSSLSPGKGQLLPPPPHSDWPWQPVPLISLQCPPLRVPPILLSTGNNLFCQCGNNTNLGSAATAIPPLCLLHRQQHPTPKSPKPEGTPKLSYKFWGRILAETKFPPFRAVYLWTSDLTSLCLCIFISRMGIIKI